MHGQTRNGEEGMTSARRVLRRVRSVSCTVFEVSRECGESRRSPRHARLCNARGVSSAHRPAVGGYARASYDCVDEHKDTMESRSLPIAARHAYCDRTVGQSGASTCAFVVGYVLRHTRLRSCCAPCRLYVCCRHEYGNAHGTVRSREVVAEEGVHTVSCYT